MCLLNKPAVFFLHKHIEHSILKSRSYKNLSKYLVDSLCRIHVKRTVKDNNTTEWSLGIS